MTSLDDVATRLYGLAPEEFTAARDEAVRAARAAGDRDLARAVGALRRPTVGAWLVNLLAHRRADLITDLIGLGAQLRSAQRQLRGDELRVLSARRKVMVREMASQARALAVAAGRGVRDALPLAEVESTLTAALADDEVAETVRLGRVVKTVAYAGFGELPRPQLRLLRGGGEDGPAPEPGEPRRRGGVRVVPGDADPFADAADAAEPTDDPDAFADEPAWPAPVAAPQRKGGLAAVRALPAQSVPPPGSAEEAALAAAEAAEAEAAAEAAALTEAAEAEEAAAADHRRLAEEQALADAERRREQQQAAAERAEIRRRTAAAHRELLAARTALAEAEAARTAAERAVRDAKRRVEAALAAVEATRSNA